ncbi:hypothetical protein K2Z84_21480 [Candidatus Binatia bacterium]|nr:hypothetical protein [Candidatus Binatia bacterium]
MSIADVIATPRTDCVRVTHRSMSGFEDLVGACADFDAYKALPEVVEFDGRLWGLTGWNSDTGRACWQPEGQSGVRIGRAA